MTVTSNSGEQQSDGEELAALIAEGQAEADRGELIDAEEVFAEIRRRSSERRMTKE